MSTRARFRFTPTPSGFLHRGNALNFVLIWWQAKLLGGEIVLRIDDQDETRVRDEYLENIFETLKWLGLDWDEGPRNANEQKAKFSQILKKDFYKKELLALEGLFGCECTRSNLAPFGGIYPGTCRKKKLELREGHAIRFNTDLLNLEDESFKDFILWRKDDLPSYQWVSLIEDRDMKISHIIRGEDLRGSSLFQKSLADYLGWRFPNHIFHHALIKKEGEKISKATKASSLFEEFSDPKGFYQDVLEGFFQDFYGVSLKVEKAQDLLGYSQNLFN